MIENELFSFVFMIWINQVGFMWKKSYFLKYRIRMDVLPAPISFSSSFFEAFFISSTELNFLSKISFVPGPIPFILSRSDLIKSDERLFL